MRRFSIGCSLAAALGLTAWAGANVGTGLSFDQFQAGSESTNNTIVNNGGFETLAEGAAAPAGWTLNGTFGAGTPVGGNTQNSGNAAAQGPFGAPDPVAPAFNGFSQSVSLNPGNYFLSAYLWSFGSNFDLTVAELLDGNGAFVTNVALTRNDPLSAPIDGSRGAFFYAPFQVPANDSEGGTPYTLLVKFDLDESVGGARPSIAGQIDNVAITPALDFVPPSVPEPASLGLVALAALGAMRRARR
ncbi:MAG TPA: PEP-CTERM sorting domain-containing protein [Tepidisphaeraceae bacterium]|nr:PEP-CTERM sorting domain-containing protein [Tepidisphaeraceae bacterium]